MFIGWKLQKYLRIRPRLSKEANLDLLKPMKTYIATTVFQKAENFVLKIIEGSSYKLGASAFERLYGY